MKFLALFITVAALFIISSKAQINENCYAQQRAYDLCQLAIRECPIERYTLYAMPVSSTASQCVWQVFQTALVQCGTAARLSPITENITRIDGKLYGMIQIGCGGHGSKH